MKRLLIVGFCTICGLLLVRAIVQRFMPFPHYDDSALISNQQSENLMSEADFWLLIEAARSKGFATYDEQLGTLGDELALLDTVRIRQFDCTLHYLMRASYNAQLWEAAYAVNGGCSDDCFEYFRSWLIAQGRDRFYWTLRHPRLLLLTGRSELLQNYEGLVYVAAAQYKSKTGRGMPECNIPAYQLIGNRFKEQMALLRYPDLWLLVW